MKIYKHLRRVSEKTRKDAMDCLRQRIETWHSDKMPFSKLQYSHSIHQVMILTSKFLDAMLT